jgi:ubiquinone/menaquinone biosynthesis C-methylase UbiE
MNVRGSRYPALIVSGLTPFYDLFARLFIPQETIKGRLIARARLATGQCVLDLGAGSGTLAIMIKRVAPDVTAIALDGDSEILAVAQEKASRSGVAIHFHLGNASDLPYAGESIDRIFSSLVFSLLNNDDKQRAIGEAYRVLAGGGELHIADFGPPQTQWARLVAPLVGRFEPISGNLSGLIPAMCQAAGFESVDEAVSLGTLFGTIAIMSFRKPAGDMPWEFRR